MATKIDIVLEIAKRTGIEQQAVRQVVQMTLDAITETLASSGRLELRNFGVFDEINRRRRGRRKIRPHLLRHSIAVHLLRGGADVRYVQQFLGHASLDTTRIYLEMVPGRLKEDYNRSFPEIAVKA